MTRPYLIGLAGPAGVGKDTVACMLDEPASHYALARPLKAALSVIGLPEPANRADKEKLIPGLGFSWRQAAQTLGTEWGRALHPELWLELAKREQAKRDGHKWMVITDVRFENEAQWVREGGTLVHVFGRETSVEGVSVAHASEKGLFVYPQDLRLDNSGSFEDLRRAVRIARIEIQHRWELAQSGDRCPGSVAP